MTATAGAALERTAVPLADVDRADAWTVGTTCSVAYYNVCTGWVWLWSGWGPNDRVGVQFDNCCGDQPATLVSSWVYVWTASPAGWGFTGTIDVQLADASGCPQGTSLATQPFLPISGWNLYTWDFTVIWDPFVISATTGPNTVPNPLTFASDHPAAGPTGPAACGTCYPTTRENHSGYFGTDASPLCPGSPLNDGACDAQLLWDAQLGFCEPPISVHPGTWGTIKALYR